MNKLFSKIQLLFLLTLLFTGCLKKQVFPPEPSVSFIDFTQKPDSAYLRCSFTDGDGDIGIESGDTTVKYDFFVNYYEKHNGNYELIVLPFPLNYRVPYITPTGNNKAIEAELKLKWSAPYYSPFLNIGDTIKYEFYMKDRANHQSNTASTGDIIVRY